MVVQATVDTDADYLGLGFLEEHETEPAKDPSLSLILLLTLRSSEAY